MNSRELALKPWRCTQRLILEHGAQLQHALAHQPASQLQSRLRQGTSRPGTSSTWRHLRLKAPEAFLWRLRLSKTVSKKLNRVTRASSLNSFGLKRCPCNCGFTQLRGEPGANERGHYEFGILIENINSAPICSHCTRNRLDSHAHSCTHVPRPQVFQASCSKMQLYSAIEPLGSRSPHFNGPFESSFRSSQKMSASSAEANSKM